MLVRFERFPITTPFEGISNFERSIDDLFHNYLGTGSRAGFPAMDIVEHENESLLIAEVPGVRKDDIKISIHDGMLTISGERKPVAQTEDAEWIRNEIPTGAFNRSLMLPHDVAVDQVSAELTNGVLRVTLPKAEEARPREIKVQ